MGKGGMVGGGTTPLKTKILANHPPYDVGPRAQGGGKFLAAEGGRKFFHPPWEAIFSKITTPVKKYWPTFISKVPPWPNKFFLTPLPWPHPHGSKFLAAKGGRKFFTHPHPLGHHPPYILDLAHVWNGLNSNSVSFQNIKRAFSKISKAAISAAAAVKNVAFVEGA